MKKHTIRITEEQFKQLLMLKEDSQTPNTTIDAKSISPEEFSLVSGKDGINLDFGQVGTNGNNVVSVEIPTDDKKNLVTKAVETIKNANKQMPNIGKKIVANPKNLSSGDVDALKTAISPFATTNEEKNKTFSKKQLKEMKSKYLNSIGTKFSKKDIYKR